MWLDVGRGWVKDGVGWGGEAAHERKSMTWLCSFYFPSIQRSPHPNPCRKDKISLKAYDGTFFGISAIPQACIFNLSGKWVVCRNIQGPALPNRSPCSGPVMQKWKWGPLVRKLQRISRPHQQSIKWRTSLFVSSMILFLSAGPDDQGIHIFSNGHEVIKSTRLMPFSENCLDLEMIILSQWSPTPFWHLGSNRIYNGILFRHKKRMKFCLQVSIMDGLVGRYAKWNKSEGKRQILYNVIDMWNLKTTTD